MNFKKKLFMMSLVASMVVPSNLALVASVATPVLADNEDEESLFSKKIQDLFEPEDGNYDIDVFNKTIWIKKGHYKLMGDGDLEDYKIDVQGDVTINLAGHKITSRATYGFTVSGTLILTGPGTVNCTSTDIHATVVDVNGVGDTGAEPVKLYVEEGVTLNASNGLGIYQFGNSETYLTNCTVEGKTGVDIQGGKLVVSGGKITATSNELKVDNGNSNWSGSHFTYGAAIAMVPVNNDYASSIEVNINDLTLEDGTVKNSTLEGKAGLILIDLKELGDREFEGDVSLQVNKNTQFGSSNTYNVGYTEAMKNFVNEIEPSTSKFHRLKYENTTSEWPTLVAHTTSISSSNVTLGSQSLPYTGKALTQKVTVTDGSNKLDPDTDYIVEYENNTNVGTATVNVKGIRDYTGEVTQTFEITPASITENSISFKTLGPYSLVEGKCEPEIEVQVNGTPLVLETDYTVEYSVDSTQDSGTVTVTGKGNYTGTATATFDIKEALAPEQPTSKDITDDNVSLAQGPYVLEGEKCEPEVTVTFDGSTLKKDKDYTVVYTDSNKVGTATVKVAGIGDYKGEVSLTYVIQVPTLSKITISDPNVSLATGSYTLVEGKCEPEVTVTFDGSTLEKDKDYTVVYTNSDKIGTATVTVTGIGEYEGTVSKTYEIIEAQTPVIPQKTSIAEATITLEKTSYTYTGNAIEPKVTSVTLNGTSLEAQTDYTVSYSKNTEASTGIVTITGKGNYEGTITKTFTIAQAPINEATVTVNPSASTYTGTAIESTTVTVTLGNKTLTKGTDYTVIYGSNTAVGQATVTVTGIGNYTGTTTGNFTITEASIAQAEITGLSGSYTYTGVAIEPTPTVNVNGQTLVKGTDYTLTYENNTNLGTATITVTGIGNYTGTARATFEIEKPTIKSSNVTLAPGPYVLDNGKCEPVVTVVVNRKTLVEGTDYDVFYTSSGGIGAVSVVGKGNYKGTVEKRYTIKSKTFTSDDISLAPGPYLISKSNFAPKVTVIGLSEDNYRVIYSFPMYEDGYVIGGEAKVTVIGQGDYAGCMEFKTYLILDDRDGTLDLSFTAGDDDDDTETQVNLSIPLEDLPKDENGDSIITDETLSVVMTNGSKVVTQKETPDCRPVAPDYIIKVTGINSVDDLKPKTNVTVETNSSSAVKLKFKGASKDPNPSISINFPINRPEDQSEISVLADEPVIFEAAEEDRVIYEQLKNIDTNSDKIIEKEEMENYISKHPQYRDVYIPDDFRQDFSKPLQLGIDVYLDQDGFIEIEIPNTSTTDTDTKPSDSSSHKPTTPKPTPITPEEPAEPTTPSTPTTMYRLYNRLTGEHLYTTDKAERDHLLTSDTWKDEGQGWVAPEVSDYPVYRLLNPNTGDHHYTTDENEYTTLQTLGWVGEDIAFYSADKDDSENVILHRLYNPNAQETGMHHYTTDENERDTLVAQGWKYEGTAWAGLKSE